MSKVNVEFYDLPDGTCPAVVFLDSLDLKMQAKMVRTIELLEQNGNELRAPYSKYIDDGLFELRAQVGNNISRVMYFFFDGGSAILTHGFIKKTQATPPREIERARMYKREYLSRRKG